MKNLGDTIATFAQPFAGGIDVIFGTNIKGCRGCNTMRENLNAGMSLTDAIYERWFKANQQGDNMKYQVTIVIEADTATKAVEKAETVGEVLSAQVRPQPQRPQLTPGRPQPTQ